MTVKVLIVDDSSFFRKRLAEIIATDPRLQVIATASNGEEAIREVQRHHPDVVTMDLEMPVMDGITAVRKIKAIRNTPVLMLSTWTTEGAKSTLDALEAGATDFLPKRFEDLSSDKVEAQRKLCQRIYQLSSGFHANHSDLSAANRIVKSQVSVPVKADKSSNTTPELVAIGTSTGGPVALQKVLTQLPANFPCPILLIQHMPATFTPSFAERLNTQCAIRVKQAENGEVLQAGTAYLAPGGQQMLLKGRPNHLYVSIEAGDANETYKPCVDLTFDSIANICGAKTLAVILTGMGSDGRNGCENIKKRTGTVWAQDQQSSTIYGMPMAVAKAGLADKILDINDIGRQLAELS
ncbi:MAG: chemotaxis response regulator protein-glutamate methylesterase [Pseudomonadota bacterium]|uniref:Protein-glutamate methylesterase/protein-glutamine glutaminase n=2 Tax=Methylophaga TaxID=40222 RepID=F5T1Z2_9GAMM|nr:MULTISPECIES: chemotaxis response regulator protein-glutamate methylesterase [Methylophaga]MEC9412906.1 chemotaxis response regulator protein-glutamate methylesterase [Pseudomonadota bacterium]EGL53402.1 chemotaxis response regulator containing a CheY-like receiver domain and a methylesterase domain containing protein [Methylophaga aminisulfidivorans MP]WVI84811.1 chemotaxis response regulator protein-glutamate methylesterase [Methylophaga thalassica]GLP99887.1 chemotaxis response regulator 